MSKTMDTNEKKENRQMPAGGGEIVPFAEDSVTKINAANVSQEQIQARIFSIRGEQVMLDRDLAMFYGVETKRINERVKRNTTRFPEDFLLPTHERRMGVFKVAKCDLRKRARATHKVHSLRLHRTGSCTTLQRPQDPSIPPVH